MVFTIHWHESAVDLHVFPILNLPSLHLERKVRTNLDGILKSRDISLSPKVCIVKAMVFPVVMYGCESWTIKKAEELMLLNCGVGKES